MRSRRLRRCLSGYNAQPQPPLVQPPGMREQGESTLVSLAQAGWLAEAARASAATAAEGASSAGETTSAKGAATTSAGGAGDWPEYLGGLVEHGEHAVAHALE